MHQIVLRHDYTASTDKFSLVPYELTPEQEEPGADDIQTFDIVLHKPAEA